MVNKLFDLTGQVAVVTGVNNAISSAIARALAEAGADVTLVASKEQALEAARASMPSPRCEALKAEATKAADVERIVQATLGRYGKIDILVNGEDIVFAKPLTEIEETEWRRVFDVNVNATFTTTKIVGAHMLQRAHGSVINLTSAMGRRGVANCTAYAASRAAIIEFTKSLALEWATKGVRVNAIAPGWIQNHWPRTEPDYATKILPARRRGTPEEVAPAAVMLASDAAASFITGQIIYVDGGQMSHA